VASNRHSSLRRSGGELAPREWFALLEPDRPVSEYGYAGCPLHDDHVPSLKPYDEPRDGWYCWACARGGDVHEYAAWRWYGRAGRELDARDFRALVARVNTQSRGAHAIPAPYGTSPPTGRRSNQRA
jgi:hypothetical protein